MNQETSPKVDELIARITINGEVLDPELISTHALKQCILEMRRAREQRGHIALIRAYDDFKTEYDRRLNKKENRRFSYTTLLITGLISLIVGVLVTLITTYLL